MPYKKWLGGAGQTVYYRTIGPKCLKSLIQNISFKIQNTGAVLFNIAAMMSMNVYLLVYVAKLHRDYWMCTP